MCVVLFLYFFFFSSRRRHTRLSCDWSSDVCSSDLFRVAVLVLHDRVRLAELGSELLVVREVLEQLAYEGIHLIRVFEVGQRVLPGGSCTVRLWRIGGSPVVRLAESSGACTGPGHAPADARGAKLGSPAGEAGPFLGPLAHKHDHPACANPPREGGAT